MLSYNVIMKKYRSKGYLSGITAAVSYGTNPLFALPMYARGMEVNSVLFYRYFFAAILYGLWLKYVKKISFKITKKEAAILFGLGMIFSLSSLTLFDSFNYLDSGLACTILFVYPIMIALISMWFFKEKLPKVIWYSLILTTIGIILLYGGKTGETLSIKGIILVLLSALLDAVYMVFIKYIKEIRNIKYDKFSFYIMLFGLLVYVWNLKFCTKLQPINSAVVLGCSLMLAIFPTIISIETITVSIKIIGPTITSIIGALEPLTALFFGILLFGESLTLKISIGILLILSGVIMVIANKKN